LLNGGSLHQAGFSRDLPFATRNILLAEVSSDTIPG
jgi:hypothetical protein